MRVSGVLEEAEFYNIADLVSLVKQQIADHDASRNQVCRLCYNVDHLR